MSDITFISIDGQLTRMNSAFEDISHCFHERDIGTDQTRNDYKQLGNLLDEVILPGPEPKLSQKIQVFVNSAYSLANIAIEYSIDFDAKWNNQVRAESIKRESERRDAWILWRHKLVRWISTIAIAVFLYSFVVWISEILPFIKVPIRDFIMKN